MDASNSSTTKPLYRGTQAVWYILGILEAFLAFRFVFKLLGANAGATFTGFVYNVSSPFVWPFLNVFKISRVVQGSIFEWTTLLAMLVYWLLAWAIIKLFIMGKSVSTPEAADKLDRQDK
ncbi:MAG: YggT family protein [bacterium]